MSQEITTPYNHSAETMGEAIGLSEERNEELNKDLEKALNTTSNSEIEYSNSITVETIENSFSKRELAYMVWFMSLDQ